MSLQWAKWHPLFFLKPFSCVNGSITRRAIVLFCKGHHFFTDNHYFPFFVGNFQWWLTGQAITQGFLWVPVKIVSISFKGHRLKNGKSSAIIHSSIMDKRSKGSRGYRILLRTLYLYVVISSRTYVCDINDLGFKLSQFTSDWKMMTLKSKKTQICYYINKSKFKK